MHHCIMADCIIASLHRCIGASLHHRCIIASSHHRIIASLHHCIIVSLYRCIIVSSPPPPPPPPPPPLVVYLLSFVSWNTLYKYYHTSPLFLQAKKQIHTELPSCSSPAPNVPARKSPQWALPKSRRSLGCGSSIGRWCGDTDTSCRGCLKIRDPQDTSRY